MTAYVIDGLTQAKQAGYDVEEARLVIAREKLQHMLRYGKTESGADIDVETRAFMAYALLESGGLENEVLDKLFRERNSLQPYGRALLALTLKLNKNEDRAREVAVEIERSVTTDNGGAHWESHRAKMLDFAEQNDVEASALSLKALARIKPDSRLLPQAARWLVSRRQSSYYWNSTKDTAFAISGLTDYLKVSRELAPDYSLEVYLNGETVAAQRVSTTTSLQSVVIQRRAGEIPSNSQIRVVKRGKGVLYFSTSVDYFTGDEHVAARGSSDLNLTREYLRLRVVEDGYKLKWQLEPLTGEIRSGDLLVVRLQLYGSKARHVMIEDPIPAGAEQVENVGNLNLDYTSGNNWTDWYSSREFRDQRTVFFLDYFDGDTTLQYSLRVQVPGEFRIAPART
ncbi:MAG: hypothetical protein ACRD6N_08115, partial [Pyrinomonadaceae bacterium]